MMGNVFRNTTENSTKRYTIDGDKWSFLVTVNIWTPHYLTTSTRCHEEYKGFILDFLCEP
jgi:hypothetical protein